MQLLQLYDHKGIQGKINNIHLTCFGVIHVTPSSETKTFVGAESPQKVIVSEDGVVTLKHVKYIFS